MRVGSQLGPNPTEKDHTEEVEAIIQRLPATASSSKASGRAQDDEDAFSIEYGKFKIY